MTSTPLHIAFDVGPLYGHRTGVGVAVDGVLSGLAERDDVVVDPYLVSFRSRPDVGHLRLPVPGIVASHIWARADRPRVDRWLGGADVVHGTNYVAPPTQRPTVVSVYDCWFLERPELANAIVRRAGDTLRRRVAAGAWVHASSQATAGRVRELLGTDRVATVLLGPPPVAGGSHADTTVTSGLEGRRFVVCVATEERRKGLPLLVEAFAHLAADDGDVHLVLAGAPGDDTEVVDDALDALSTAVRSRVHRLGPVDPPTKHWLLRRAAALAYPSIDEGFGFPILEGQAAGTPVVAMRVGSVPEIAGAAAVLVGERSPIALADALHRVLTDGVVRLGLIEAGYRNVGLFRWADTANGLVELYRRAVDPS